MDLDLSAIAGVLSLLLCWGTGGGGEAVSQAQDSPTATPQGAVNSSLLFFLEPSSMSGLRVTMTTLTMRLLPPCRIMLTTCLWPTFTTFCPLTWDDDGGWEQRKLATNLQLEIWRPESKCQCYKIRTILLWGNLPSWGQPSRQHHPHPRTPGTAERGRPGWGWTLR